jgi:TetR/AcrR family transcriptional repressor of nem operon
LCGMLATEVTTVSSEIRMQIEGFFADHTEWIARMLNQKPHATLEQSRKDAQALLAGLEGALLVARASGGAERFEADARTLLEGFL